MQPRCNVVQHLIPWDTHVVSIQVENAALELSALGAAVHIPLEVDIQMLFPRARPVTEWTWDIMLDSLVSNIQNCWFMVGADRVPAGHAGYFWVLRPICCNGLYCYSTSVSSLILFPPFSQYEPIELNHTTIGTFHLFSAQHRM